nr:hypothetical protein [Tanacetum cinerariifolium]
VSVAHEEIPTVTKEPSIPSLTPPTPPPEPPQDIPSTSQLQQTPPQSPQLKRRVKKLEKWNNVRVLKLRRLQKVGTSQRVDTSDDTVMDDEPNQGRMIAEMDKDDAVVLMDDKEEDKKVDESAQKQHIEHDEHYARELHAEQNKDIYWDEAIDHVKRKAKEDPAV